MSRNHSAMCLQESHNYIKPGGIRAIMVMVEFLFCMGFHADKRMVTPNIVHGFSMKQWSGHSLSLLSLFLVLLSESQLNFYSV